MKLVNKKSYPSTNCVCELTKQLDDLAKLSEQIYYESFYHYIVTDDYCKNEKCLAIRVPGGTVGGLWFDDNNVITKIVIDTNYVVKTYPDNVNDLIKDFIGKTIEFE